MKGLLCTCALLLCTTIIAIAQIEERIEIELVEVYVSALNKEGSPIQDLTGNDFVLKENGKEQRISYFSRLLDADSQIPLTIGFLVDTSGSMHKGTDKLRRIDVAKTFASLFLKEVKPGDTIQVLAFDNVFRSLTPMTSDITKINQALSEVQIDVHANPSTALLKATDLTWRYLEPFPGRKIMILCSDGQNNVPGPTPEELITSLKKHDITVLSLATVTDLEWHSTPQVSPGSDGSLQSISVQRTQGFEAKNARKLMKQLAEETGGYAFFPENNSKLNEAIEKLRSVIRSQYALTYKPPRHKGNSWQKIEVKCKRKDVKLRYRQGYFSQ